MKSTARGPKGCGERGMYWPWVKIGLKESHAGNKIVVDFGILPMGIHKKEGIKALPRPLSGQNRLRRENTKLNSQYSTGYLEGWR